MAEFFLSKLFGETVVCGCQFCPTQSLIFATFSGVNQSCPSCSPSGKGVLDSKLIGLVALTQQSVTHWLGSVSGASYRQYNDEDCLNPGPAFTNQLTVVGVNCVDGIYTVRAEVATETADLVVFEASGPGPEISNTLPCGGIVTISL